MKRGVVVVLPLKNVNKAGEYLGTGIGIVFVLLGRRFVDGKPPVLGRGRSPGSVLHHAVLNKAVSSISTKLT